MEALRCLAQIWTMSTAHSSEFCFVQSTLIQYLNKFMSNIKTIQTIFLIFLEFKINELDGSIKNGIFSYDVNFSFLFNCLGKNNFLSNLIPRSLIYICFNLKCGNKILEKWSSIFLWNRFRKKHSYSKNASILALQSKWWLYNLDSHKKSSACSNNLKIKSAFTFGRSGTFSNSQNSKMGFNDRLWNRILKIYLRN